ncbi:hypothetical protein ACFVTP_34015 [Streptomyces celluloflavus]|uniref:hypothetical protein n=1 Tax=Streptomyces celluloflavus TaxID=58344 RepID=UPI0036DAA7B5
MSPTARRGRPAAALAALALAAAVLSPTAAAADTPPPALTSPANSAATWAAAQLKDGSNASGDQGLTADIVLALASTGTGGRVAAKATDWLAAHTGDYVDRGAPGKVFAGGAAKLALVAAVEHRDPTDFGGHDLVATLLGRLQDSGRFTDDLPTGDMSNQFTQSLAVLALQRTGKLPSAAVDFLARSRCADGGYPLTFRADPAKCASHTDSTGLAVQALLGAGRPVDAAPGLDWLEKHQNADGGFSDNGFGTAPGNTNTTALDVQALTAGGRTATAAKGLAWLISRQVRCDGAEADRGAVGYQEPKADGSALRATAQAVPALAGKSLDRIDGRNAADGLEPIGCSPGTTTGGTGDPGTGGTDRGATDGGTHSGGATGGPATGGSTGSSTGGGTGTEPSTGPTPSTGSTPPAGPGTDSGGAAAGGSGPSGGGPAQTTTGGSGGLAATGTPALSLAGAAAALTVAGAVTVLAVRRRRTA